MNSNIDTVLAELEPQPVWQWFSRICAIPHPSHHEQVLASYIEEQAKARGLETARDAVGNLLIKRAASPSRKDAPVIGIQAHIDMVAQRGDDSTHDFERDPIRTFIEGDWVRADDTTLGADNGIGAAMGLALVFSSSQDLPAITLILTVEEETGMGGAFGLSPQWFDMPYLLNLDTEEEASLYIGCAGGRDATFNFECRASAVPEDWQPWRLEVSGLQGGHSGLDIDQPLGNANVLTAQLLAELASAHSLRLQHIEGGTLRNAIARRAEAVFFCEKKDAQEMQARAEAAAARIKKAFDKTEKALQIRLKPLAENCPQTAVDAEQSHRFIRFLAEVPNGVITMSQECPGVVETSISMGVVSSSEEGFSVLCLMRSLKESPKDALSARLQQIADASGVSLEVSGDYPGWQPDPSSLLLRAGKPLFDDYFAQDCRVKVVHAGLECGLLKGHAPHTEMISFGPNIQYAHSPRERVQISSVRKNWEVLLRFIDRICELEGEEAADPRLDAV